MTEELKNAMRRKADKSTFLQTVSAVLWSFFGVRKGANHTADMEKLNPVHVIVVGLLAAALFVVTLVLVVHWVVK